MGEAPSWHGTTIVCVRKGDKVVIAGEGRGQAPLFKVFESHQHPGSKEARVNRELVTLLV